jgi:glycosyltransferase involved in cell wall biosynthesis
MTADAVGGVWTYALDLAQGLVAHGVETTLALMGPEPDAAQRAAAHRVPGLRLERTGAPLDWLAEAPAQVEAAARLVAALAARFDVVQLNTPALAALARFPVPVVAVSHSCLATWWDAVRGGALPHDFAWRAALHGEGLSAADRVVAPTRAFARATSAAYARKVVPESVYNGRAPAALRPAPGLDAVFTAGRLWDEGKGAATLDRAAAGLGWPVLAAGPVAGPNGAYIELRHAQALGSLDAVAVAGWLARRPVFASAALYEPFGLAALEAAQAGCALVLSDIPSFRELWEGAAVFVPPRDDARLAEALRGVLRDPARRAALGEAARLRAQDYTVARMATGMHALLRGQGRAAA